jgi:hypothetical protein
MSNIAIDPFTSFGRETSLPARMSSISSAGIALLHSEQFEWCVMLLRQQEFGNPSFVLQCEHLERARQ